MHWTITGRSGCGKSRLVREVLIPLWRGRGVACCVLDPLRQPWPGASWTTDDPRAFVAAAQASQSCVWFADEFGHYASDYETARALQWLWTIGRNHGHLSYAMAQRVLQIPPNVRNQCANAVVFQQSIKDLEDLARLNNSPAILGAAELPAGHALVVEPFRPLRRIRVW